MVNFAIFHTGPISWKRSKSRKTAKYCHLSYAGNYELVKSIMGTKFRSHVCLHSQAGNKL